MHAVIMAGGKGVRLRPYTTTLPKPLVPIGDRHAIVEIVLQQLASCGFTSATLAINHLGQLIRAFVGNGSRWGIDIDYVEETMPLSTIGPSLSGIQSSPLLGFASSTSQPAQLPYRAWSGGPSKCSTARPRRPGGRQPTAPPWSRPP